MSLIPLFSPFYANADTDIYSMDLDQLSNIKVTSVSKKPQSLLETAAAVHVISQEEIRRSGATSLPEVLRGVPGVQVAQIDANKWAVSIRGFNDHFGNKLLVMVDGRSVYTPLFSGVYWNMQDMLLEDIDRIEVIRGPGGTMWGANAVNGVINILTKKASETQGTQLSFIGGSQEENIVARYGGKINDQTSFRLFAKGKHVENFNNPSEHQVNDQWRNFTTGFRVDGDVDTNNTWMLQGRYTTGTANQIALSPSLTQLSNQNVKDSIGYQSGNMLFLWEKQQSADSKWRVQAYYDYLNRRARSATNQVHTLDLEIQNQIRLRKDHDIVWGVGYRGILDELESSFTFSFDPKKRYTRTFNAFLQNEISLTDKFRVTLGSKVEHNSYSGFEFQPNARLLWQVNDRNSFWASGSRAVRVSSRAESDVRVNFRTAPGSSPGGPPALLSIFGNKKFNSEKVYAFELGYRSLLTETFTLDTALFYNYYDELATVEQGFIGIETEPAPTHLLISGVFGNKMTASSYGAEIIARWQVTHHWQLTSSYSWFKLDAQLKNSSTASENSVILTTNITENSDPRHQFSVRSNLQLAKNIEFDSMLNYTDRLTARDVAELVRLDLRLAWTPAPMLELSIVAQNILNKQHKEFSAPDALYSEIPRSAYGRITLRF